MSESPKLEDLIPPKLERQYADGSGFPKENMRDIQQIEIPVCLNGESLPTYKTRGSAGADLCSRVSAVLKPGERAIIPTGIYTEIPEGYEVQIRPRSGLAAKHGVTVLNSPGTIDSDYRGEWGVILINHGLEPFTVTPGMRIAQMVVAKVIQAKWKTVYTLSETKRGAEGFGSTGTK